MKDLSLSACAGCELKVEMKRVEILFDYVYYGGGLPAGRC